MTDDRAVILLVLHSEPSEDARLAEQLEDHFYGRYQVLRVTSRADATEELAALKKDGRRVAAVLADEQVEDGSGQEFLTESRSALPEKGRILLTSQPEQPGGVGQADDIRRIPRVPAAPDDLFGLTETAVFETADPGENKATVHGDRDNDRVSTTLRFLLLNFVTCKTVQKKPNVTVSVDLQIGAGKPETLDDPTLLTLATKLGLNTKKTDTYDLVVVGGGPTGMSAAVNIAALFKLKVLIVEKFAPGGEAGTAINVIENYLGFPDGIKAYKLAQLWKKHVDKYDIDWLPCYSSTKIAVMQKESDVEGAGVNTFDITVSENSEERALVDLTVHAGTVLAACGLKPQRLDPKTKAQDFEWKGVYYDALPGDVDLYDAGKDTVAIVGGGDTAGRAAAMFATGKGGGDTGVHVDLLVRGQYGKDMLSDVKKAVDDLVAEKKIVVHEYTEVSLVEKKDGKMSLTLTKGEPVSVSALYVLIGGQADTKWLSDAGVTVTKVPEHPEKDGYVLTGSDLDPKQKIPMETSVSGIFAAGDVRYGAVRRISTAVGEGGAVAISINAYHQSTKGTALLADEERPANTYYSL